MPKDIRSYFSVISKKKAPNAEESKSPPPIRNKKRLAVISSDEDEPNSFKVDKNQTKKEKKKLKNVLEDSDDDNIVPKKTEKVASPLKKPEEKLKLATLDNAFGNNPINRKETPKLVKKVRLEEANFHDEDDFEAALFEVDLDSIMANNSKGILENKDTNENINGNVKRKKDNDKVEETPSKKIKLESEETDKKEDYKNKQISKQQIKAVSSSGVGKLEVIQNEKKPKEKKKNEDEKNKKDGDEDVDMFDEIVKKRKRNAAAYQSYLNRGGARNPGSKTIPEGADNCLLGLTFVISGVLESLEREEAEELIKKYSGRIVHAVSKKTNYIVVGEEAGQAKLAKAKLYNIKQISEDDLLELIRKKSAGKETNKKDVSPGKASKNKPTFTAADDDKPKKLSSKKQDTDKVSSDLSKSPVKEESCSKNDTKDKSSKKLTHKVVSKTSPTSTNTTDKCDINEKKVLNAVLNEEKSKPNPLRSQSKSDVAKPSLNIQIECNSLVEKYRPTKLSQIIGQHTDNSCAKRLYKWLNEWNDNHFKQHKKMNPVFKKADGLFKAALLSGPPGIGKTTTVQVVCNALGFDLIEFNASDTRNKTLLKDQVSSLLSNKTVKGYFTNDKNEKSTITTKKHVLVMDEVDGMAGNEDRGGLQELISLIKNTDTPIVCICNDRNHPKMRTLVNYTADICFPKPKLEQIRGAMRSICCKENIEISKDNLDHLIESTNYDIRQIINHLSMFIKVSDSTEVTVSSKLNKDLKLGPWDVLRKVFSAEEHKNMTIHDKSNLFFHDYNIAGLFVYENYPNVQPKSNVNLLKCLAKSADSLSLGDMVENAIRKNNAWSLLPTQACFSSVIPGTVMSGTIKARINFPSWLGRNSRTGKFDRLLQEITVHTRLTTKSSKEAINIDYLHPLRDAITQPLIKDRTDGVKDAVDVMNAYNLLREDLDSIVEVSLWPGQKDPMQVIDSQVKSAFTRAYNKSAFVTPFSINANGPKKKANQLSQDEGFIEDDNISSDEENENDDNINNDKMVKAKKPSVSKEKTSTTSKPKVTGSKRGRGRGK